ncbi:polysaccharide biosynthesis/export family protein [Sphingobacterium lumbrici]|uniref:polysaccharide biosynthesis/export family protein n=1 Tax=Sphingobacterium lumbrici TaxID=2559600 RepID=UPI00112E447A|nr:polysaccharide biosynthesis/export family protein [Sphingobacterium lumbrici]
MPQYLRNACLVLFVIGILFMNSCASRRDVIYFQKNEYVLDSAFSVDFVKIKPMDRLRINVSGPEEEAIAPFRVSTVQGGGGAANQILYTVEQDGHIVLPYLGRVLVQGKTRLEVVGAIRESLKRYVKDPVVDVHIENFRVTVLGHITPQVLDFSTTDRPTLLEAIAQAGDIRINAKRDDILVIREESGKRVSYRVDLRDADIFNSPAYYLAQNDIIYIEPNSSAIQANRSTWYITLGMTIITVGLTILNVFNR